MNNACVVHFLSIKSKLIAPFRITLKGTVSSAQEVAEATVSGTAKKSFHVVDDTGTWIPCIALGRHANSRVIQNNAEIVIYCAAGRQSFSTSPAALYLFKDASIVVLGFRTTAVPERMRLEIL